MFRGVLIAYTSLLFSEWLERERQQLGPLPSAKLRRTNGSRKTLINQRGLPVLSLFFCMYLLVLLLSWFVVICAWGWVCAYVCCLHDVEVTELIL